MPEIVKAHDLSFKKYITEEEIRQRIRHLGQQISDEYRDKKPLFLGVLNGAFIFTADLVRACNIDCEVSFIKLSSYKGIQSTGKVSEKIGLEKDLSGRHVIIVEDIVDSGKTLYEFLPVLQAMNPSSVAITALLVKPEAMKYEIQVDYEGFRIPTRFVLGYGLDYEGLGRNLPAIYQLTDS